MSESPQSSPNAPPVPAAPGDSLARRPGNSLSPILPGIAAAGAQNLPFAPPQHRYPESAKPKTAVLRGLKELQQLQKQTLAVLEAVQGSLDDIQQVLRSPEATRGLEKQRNAATLLAKGFPRDAVEQASGAAALLPANPEAHLLLALSLTADQQPDPAIAATRKGLALIDRRLHPLAIEAGLLHTLAALGHVPEAIDRWSAIIESLPLPVLLEQTGRIAACFPAGAGGAGMGGALLDTLLTARLAHRPAVDSAPGSGGTGTSFAQRAPMQGRRRLIDTAPPEIPASSLLAGLDAAEAGRLPLTHRAILAQISRRLLAADSASELLRFMTECLVPLANRPLERATRSLARSTLKRLLRLHADAGTLHRALLKFQMAEARKETRAVARLLQSWRKAGTQQTRMRAVLLGAAGAFGAGIVILGWTLMLTGKSATTSALNPLWVGAGFIAVGAAAGLWAAFLPSRAVSLPEGRPPLSPEEVRFLQPATIRHSLRSALSREAE